MGRLEAKVGTELSHALSLHGASSSFELGLLFRLNCVVDCCGQLHESFLNIYSGFRADLDVLSAELLCVGVCHLQVNCSFFRVTLVCTDQDRGVVAKVSELLDPLLCFFERASISDIIDDKDSLRIAIV